MKASQATTFPKAEPRPSDKVRLRLRIAVLLVMSLLAVAVWHLSLRTHAGPASGESLSGTFGTGVARQTLRVGTFNIHRGIGADGEGDLDRIGEELGGFDLLGLNEVQGGGLWPKTNQAQLLGEKLKMPFLFAPTERRWGGEHFGNGMLCSVPVKNWLRIPLPSQAKKGLRNMLLATVDLGGRDVQVLITHVDAVTDREEQLRIVIAMFLSLDEPAILMGDLNSRADDEQLQALLGREGVQDVTDGRGRIDWIITRGLQTIRAEVRETNASDHPLIWAELRLDE